jgi:hypothetical protein
MTAALEGLYDPLTRPHALATLSDSDLILAALVQNETAIHPGQSELHAASNFAELWLHARTLHDKATIARIACTVIDPTKFGAATAKILGYDKVDHRWCLFLKEHATGVTVLREVLTQVFTTRYACLPAEYVWSSDLLLELSQVLDDPAVFAELARKNRPHTVRVAASRLVQLGCIEECDELLATRSGPVVAMQLASVASREALERFLETGPDAFVRGYIERAIELRQSITATI